MFLSNQFAQLEFHRTHPACNEYCQWIAVQRVHAVLQFQCTDALGLAFSMFLLIQTAGMTFSELSVVSETGGGQGGSCPPLFRKGGQNPLTLELF